MDPSMPRWRNGQSKSSQYEFPQRQDQSFTGGPMLPEQQGRRASDTSALSATNTGFSYATLPQLSPSSQLSMSITSPDQPISLPASHFASPVQHFPAMYDFGFSQPSSHRSSPIDLFSPRAFGNQPQAQSQLLSRQHVRPPLQQPPFQPHQKPDQQFQQQHQQQQQQQQQQQHQQHQHQSRQGSRRQQQSRPMHARAQSVPHFRQTDIVNVSQKIASPQYVSESPKPVSEMPRSAKAPQQRAVGRIVSPGSDRPRKQQHRFRRSPNTALQRVSESILSDVEEITPRKRRKIEHGPQKQAEKDMPQQQDQQKLDARKLAPKEPHGVPSKRPEDRWMLRGSCACGHVQYGVSASPAELPFQACYCHCALCRNLSGSNYVAFTSIPTSRLRWYSGQRDWLSGHGTDITDKLVKARDEFTFGTLPGFVTASADTDDADGSIRLWSSSRRAVRGSCARCGSTLFISYHSGGTPTTDIALGTLWHTEERGVPLVKPVMHIMLREKPPWEPVPDDGLLRYDGMPGDGGSSGSEARQHQEAVDDPTSFSQLSPSALGSSDPTFFPFDQRDSGADNGPPYSDSQERAAGAMQHLLKCMLVY